MAKAKSIETAPSAPFTAAWPDPAAMGTAWTEAVQKGSLAWMQASGQILRAFMDLGAAQAKALQALTAQTMKQPNASPWLAGANEVLRDELLLANEQALRTADAVRQTLTDLGIAEESPAPLPD